jgi:hypothetical protein
MCINEEVPFYDVFISYHKESELKLARKVKRKLSQSEGKIKCFVADDDRISGMQEVRNIKGAIRNSMSMLVLYNKKAVNSCPIITEINIACKFNEERVIEREIIIFKEKEVHKTNLPECVEDINYIKFDIKKPDYLINRVLEKPWRKNPNTIESIHTSYEEAKNYQLLNSQLTSTEFLMEVKNMLPKKSISVNFLPRLQSIITKKLNKNTITMPEEYEELKRNIGADKALYILSVVTLKGGIHKGIF